jgi:phosphoribosylformimino-5-aminoimidazole carboxamide ribotide isomerase
MKDGRCVRLTQGLFDNLKVYSEDPVDIAKMWVSQGATFLHLVDLDGALAGQSVNRSVIRGIVESVSVPVQVGGGIRSHEAVKSMLELGVRRVIIGTRAAKEPEFIRELTARFDPEQIVAGIDAKDGLVAVEGWEKVSSITALELCLRMKEYGVRHVVYTDISRDGMLSGPNVEATKKLTKDTGLDIIASGGVSCMDDLRKLRDRGIRGAIIGKALYEKKLDLKEAVGRFQ